MKSIYLDTSSLVKVYHQEPDSDKIIKILPQYQGIFLSELTKIEFVAAFWKKVRHGEAKESESKDAIRLFENDYPKFNWVIIEREIIRSAKELVTQYRLMGLRTLDSIQLACAVSLKDETGKFLTSDKILKKIMEKEGLSVVL
jgi:uncharacterized protein